MGRSDERSRVNAHFVGTSHLFPDIFTVHWLSRRITSSWRTCSLPYFVFLWYASFYLFSVLSFCFPFVFQISVVLSEHVNFIYSSPTAFTIDHCTFPKQSAELRRKHRIAYNLSKFSRA